MNDQEDCHVYTVNRSGNSLQGLITPWEYIIYSWKARGSAGPMTQPRDGNRDPSTDLFHSCFSPLPKQYNRDCLVEPSLSALRFILQAPCQPTLGNGAQSLPTLSFLCPQGVHTVPLLPLAFTRPSSPSPPLSSLAQEGY